MTKTAQNLAFMTGWTRRTRFFLPATVVSGNSIALKGRIMAALGKGALATALATAMAVMPSLAPAQERVAAKPAPDAKVLSLPQDNKPTPLREAITYSEDHPVVVIIVSKGSKDPISGEKIGETLSNVLKKSYLGAPSNSLYGKAAIIRLSALR